MNATQKIFLTNHKRITVLTKATLLTKQVTVEDPKTGEDVNFSCQRWFSTNDDDGKISRELVRDDIEDATIIVSQGKDYWEACYIGCQDVHRLGSF